VHHYKSRNPIFGHKDLGWEADFTSLTETPRNIKVSIGLALYHRGAAIMPIQKQNTIAFVGGINVQP
jgi:hypothetical protein